MNSLRITATALNTTPLDWEGNTKKILAAIQNAKDAGVQIVCFPELCISGYGCEDMFLAPGTCEKAKEILYDKIAPATEASGIFLCVGLPTQYKGAIYNTVASVQNGEVLALHAKAHLAGDGIHYEPRWFKAWPQGKMDVTEDGIPIGDVILQLGDIKLGYEICEDAWVAERPGHRLAKEGVDVILNPSASHFSFGKIETRKRFVLEGSRAFHCAYVYSNLVGNEAGRAIYDGGAMIAACGEMLTTGPRFLGAASSNTTVDIPLSLLKSRQAASASRKVNEGPTLNLIQGDTLATPPKNKPILPDTKLEAWEKSPYLKEEEFTRAMSLGLRDYVTKSKTQGFAVSLSGGVDSAAVCCLIHYMNVLLQKGGKRIPLYTIYQATKQSSITTRLAAQEVAACTKSTHYEVNVDNIVEAYKSLFSQATRKDLTWEENDIALQNIQARARGPMAWLIANVYNLLLVATSNRSEAAVGYATMDGDTCGSLSVLAGVDKPFLIKWLKWVCAVGPEGLHPLPEIGAVIRQKPTAELRPEEDGVAQTDEADLMPYDILAEIENLLIRDKLTGQEVLEMMQQKFPEHSAFQIATWINKFQSLWQRNQWKRERYAPAFHVDDKNLDPRSWCRYPLLSGPPTKVEAPQ